MSIVDKIYTRYKYRGNWFVIARLKCGNEYITRPIEMPESRAKQLQVGDTIKL